MRLSPLTSENNTNLFAFELIGGSLKSFQFLSFLALSHSLLLVFVVLFYKFFSIDCQSLGLFTLQL